MESQDAVIRYSILDYLVRHPGAKDTREGVINWWIAKPCPDERVAIDALETLVARGWILKRATSSRPIYSLNQAHLNEIREFVSQNKPAK
ncbi:MAG TPA: hypothetical protein PKW52_11275 [Nitrospira sp.]|nr:hypothetical protein [Nitrospira sp.]MCE7975772.1 hypothetical protein [Nitrospira sp. NTP1]HQR14097.1 hypothetical protein [Nitrospira sp.]HQV11917.1 hypothetical protein [Nitrospira sp.]